MEKQFLEAVFTDGIQHPNFFNGRILTATDLRDEQAANLKRSRTLGQAIGSGVVHGLSVQASSSKKSLVIDAGLAVNRLGDGLHLPSATTVELVLTEPLAAPTSPFVPCDVSSGEVLKGNVATGYYLLAISTATRLSVTMAPNSGLGGDRPGCTNRYEEVGVQFKLVPIGLENFKDFVTKIPPSALDSRSRLAHECFGTNQLLENNKQPLSHSTSYGLVDTLHAQKRLTDCDVPLAVFRFQPASSFSPPQLAFVDMWAVRRVAQPGIHPEAFAEADLSYFVSPCRTSEAAAFFLQFQAQLEEMRTESKLNPATVIAKDYFEYLPAAGYLPISTGTIISRLKGDFQVKTFFGDTIPAQTIEPTQLRSLFRAALFDAPIRPGTDPIDIYKVDGAPSKNAYRIFARRTPVILPPNTPDADDTDIPTLPTASGDLAVTVVLTTGQKVDNKQIDFVRAVNQRTGQIYTSRGGQKPVFGFTSKATKRETQNAQARIEQRYKINTSSSEKKYRGRRPRKRPTSSATDTLAAKESGAIPYFFNDLPVGQYTLSAQLKTTNYISIPSSTKISSKLSRLATVVVKFQPSRGGGFDVFIPDDFELPGGKEVDGFFWDPEWPERYPDWEKEIPLERIKPGEGWTDPPPEDWFRRDNPAPSIQLEDSLVTKGTPGPTVAAADAVIFIRNDYNPAQPGATVAAFVQTQDGSRFPIVPLAADNALDKVASVERTGIPDFDQGTQQRLQSAGLADIDAFASAPTNLIANVIGQSPAYAESLVTETQVTLQADFRAGYLGYPGITKSQSDGLKSQFGSRVELANASPEALASALGSVSEGFAGRFLSDVKLTVPQASFDLGSAGIDTGGQGALGSIGVSSNGDLRSRASTPAGRTEIKDALSLSDTALDSLLETATLNLARGELISAPEKSIATLAGIPDSLKTAVANTGIVSAKELANTDPNELAIAAGISTAEATEIVEAAKPYGSNAHLTLIGGDVAGAAGLATAGAIARLDASSLTELGLETGTANTAIKLSNQLLADKNIFRGRRLR